VGKTGLFSAAGHEHSVSAPISNGAISIGERRVWFEIESARMTVLDEKDRDAIQSTMQNKVLESSTFPVIRFESSSVQNAGGGKLTVVGNLTLHGRTKSIVVSVREEGGEYLGETQVKQTDFGIEPVSAAGGTIKIKNELKVEFKIYMKH